MSKVYPLTIAIDHNDPEYWDKILKLIETCDGIVGVDISDGEDTWSFPPTKEVSEDE